VLLLLCVGYADNRVCLNKANAGVDCLGVYPQVLPLSVLWGVDLQYPSTADPTHITQLSELVHHAYSRHLYVPFIHTNTLLLRIIAHHQHQHQMFRVTYIIAVTTVKRRKMKVT